MNSKQNILGLCLRYVFALLGLCLWLWGLPLLVGSYAHYEGDYLLGARIKQKRLADTQGDTKKRLVLLGCSNLAFGVDSKYLEEQTGLRVVNMGLHQDLGQDYMLNESLAYLQKGDLVLIVWSYGSWRGQWQTKTQLALAYPEAERFMREELSDLGAYQTQKLQRALQISFDKLVFIKTKPKIYGLHAFDSLGDVVIHQNMSPKAFEPLRLEWGSEGQESILCKQQSSLQEFCKEVQALGAHVYMLAPALAQSSYEDNQELIEAIWQNYQTISNIRLCGSPQDFVYPDAAFFDTPSHLQYKNRRIHSLKLLKIAGILR
ncbi:MAG: hypothetical protein EAZ57_07995 [Cytophagales bacterium]|nr:MAG: hypothetical protein EAZ67_09075 [Cytophagales bacterium]TAF60275.1 MAG: hypothetical protein EAZ57_07995 [Cytophagales bacterium]